MTKTLCPDCKTELDWLADDDLTCPKCKKTFHIVDGDYLVENSSLTVDDD